MVRRKEEGNPPEITLRPWPENLGQAGPVKHQEREISNTQNELQASRTRVVRRKTKISMYAWHGEQAQRVGNLARC